ncbi:MAG TPA: peptidase S10 [Methylomirabilota bacterium]|nr:peptidase S10 [Methylomirabilota bacterium]
MKRVGRMGVAVALLFLLGGTADSWAQTPPTEPKPPEAAQPTPKPSAPPEIPKEESSVTDHTIRIGGQTIPYKATAGTILLKNEKDELVASMFYIAYIRTDVKDTSQRPLAFLYNGGPGSSSVWLHMGAFGPKRVVTSDAESTPPPPYQLEDNANSLLDAADLVFIDPIGTGFSKAVGEAKNKDFWGVDEDVKSIAQFIVKYVNRNLRWNSPKFLIGESYGTFRDAALVDYLQSHEGMYFNGVVMISTVLDFETLGFDTGSDLSYVLYLPSYAAVAWYHKTLADRPTDLNAFLTEARQFAFAEYAPALAKGTSISPAEKADVLKKLAHFTGLSEDYLTKANLRVRLQQFMDELQRARGLTTGRYDARFAGPNLDLLEEYANYDPVEAAITGPFTSALNQYLRQDLQCNKDQEYIVTSNEAFAAWDWKHKGPGGESDPTAPPNVQPDLADALVTNPHLRVQVENGLFDLATPFFSTEYTMNHLGLPASLQDHVQLEYYDAGHMMYLHVEDLVKLKGNIASFIASASKP